MYDTINETLKAYLITNEGFLDPETERAIAITQTYTEQWATKEQAYLDCMADLKRLPCDLWSHLEAIHSYNIELGPCDEFLKLTDRLIAIDEALDYEERVNFGIGPEARKLRKEWRRLVRKGHKMLSRQVKNHINWIKEWSRPRQTYVSRATGEVHNGLYWAIKNTDRKYLIYGFNKEN